MAAYRADLLRNAMARRGAPYPAELAKRFARGDYEAAREVVASWDGYAPTPLVALGSLADALGVDEICYKDEGGRFGLGSFKALGGAYALVRLLEAWIGRQDNGCRPDPGDLMRGARRDVVAGVTVTCATAGNHGRSVAWAAERCGCRCVIFVPEGTASRRVEAIARHGAKIVRVAGTYDAVVRHAAAEAARQGWYVVSDTAYPGYTEIPRHVMQGYTVLVGEALNQAKALPTHVFVQCGVGGLAAAVCAHVWEHAGSQRPCFVVVEPERAACFYASVAAGRPVRVDGSLETMMTCLACGELSVLAWEVLSRGADFAMRIPDAAEVDAIERLGRERPAIDAGPSGAAGLAGLVTAARDARARRALGLDARSRILVIGSEAGARA